MYIYICIYTYIFRCIHICIHTYICRYMVVCRVCVYIYMYIFIFTYTYLYIHTHMNIWLCTECAYAAVNACRRESDADMQHCYSPSYIPVCTYIYMVQI